MNPSLDFENSEDDWKKSLRSALKNNSELNAYFNLSINCSYPHFIPIKLAKKIKKSGPNSALWKQFVPDELENSSLQEKGHIDPIGDQLHHKSAQLIHRYKNRALFLPITACPVICRYCFRKNELDLENFEGDLFIPDREKTLNYLQEHPMIEEIIFSGGDPLIMNNEKIESYLQLFSTITSIKYIRFHSRVPVILAERITHKLVALFQKFSWRFTFIFVIHCNHQEEIDDEEEAAILKLAECSQLLSQTVLLKGVNDDSRTLRDLILKLQKLKVRPYYLHHPDKVKGGMHFYLEKSTGLIIYKELRQLIPGWMLPHYVVDDPEGSGKQAVENFFYTHHV